MSENSKSTGAKAPLNPFYKGVPFIFKRTGEVRRTNNAPRFGRKISMMASKVARECADAVSLTVTDDETTYILSVHQTQLVKDADSAIEAMVLNGWVVEPTSRANMTYAHGTLTQEDMFNAD